MAYYVYPEGTKAWRVVWERWENNKRIRCTLSREELLKMGLSKTLSREEAREQVLPYNLRERTEKREELQEKIRVRWQKKNSVFCEHLPPRLVEEFERIVLTPKRIRLEHWQAAKVAIRAVGIAPKDWYFEPWQFYNWFIEKRYSTDYSNRIRRILNEWGRFISWKQSIFWQDLPSPSLHWRTKIRIAQRKATGRRTASRRLSLEMLESKKDQLSEQEFNWLFVSIAFGLRPEEVDRALRDRELFKVASNGDTQWLSIYQFKLERLGHEAQNCWKHIPAVEPRQKRALELVHKLKRPLYRTCSKVFDPGITPYSGRKEFWNYMKGRYNPYFVRRWMGHVVGGTAEEHYEDPNDLRYWTQASDPR